MGLAALAATLFFWQALVARERAHLQQVLELEAASVSKRLSGEVESQVLALDRMARRWEYWGHTLKAEWMADAGHHVEYHPGYQAIAWVDTSLVVRWVAPAGRQAEWQDRDLSAWDRARSALDAARETQQASISRTIELPQNGPGFLVAVPLLTNDKFDGFMMGIFDLDRLLDAFLQEDLGRGYSIAVLDGTNELYRHSAGPLPPEPSGVAEADLSLENVAWRVRVQATRRLVAEQRSWLPETILAAGLLTALLLAATAYFVQTALVRARELWNRERELERSNQELERRVAERTAQLQRQTAHLRLLANELTQAEQHERKRLAQTLHDGLQQLLVAARMRLNVARAQISDRRVLELLNQADAHVCDSIQTSRTLAIELSPPVLHDGDLGQALEWLGRRFAEKYRLAVTVEVRHAGEGLPDDVKTFLFQAANELLFNVVKHAQTDRAGVCLEQRDDRQICLRVEDEGKGFDPSIGGEGQPAGLGVFGIRERLEALGGELLVDSSPGRGTRAELLIPVRLLDTQPLQAPAPVVPAASIRGPETESAETVRVLIADDHQIVRRRLALVLDSAPGVEVIGEAADGIDALEQTAILHPHVILMDVNMPRMNGIEATARIKEQFPDVHVIGLSLYREDEMAVRMKAAGADAYFTKDGPADELTDAIHRLRHAPATA